MEEEASYKDQQEASWKQKLEQASSLEQDWNMPGPQVWQHIQQQMPLPERRRTIPAFVWWILALGALSGVMIFRELKHQQTTRLYQQKLLENQKKYQQLEQKCQDQSSKIAPPGTSGNTPTPIIPVTSILPEGKGGFKKPAISSTALNVAVRKDFNAPSENTGALPTLTYEPVPAIQENPLDAIDPVPAFPLSSFTTLSTPTIKLKTRKQRHLQTYMLGGAGFGSNLLEGTRPSSIQEIQAGRVWQSGAGVVFGINSRWSIHTGMHYQQSQYSTRYLLQLPFTHQNEYQHQDGLYDNAYYHNIPTGLGEAQARFILSRTEDATIHEGDIVPLELTVRQSVQTISLPLTVHYALNPGRYQWSVHSGIAAHHLLGTSTGNPTLTSHHSSIHQRHTLVNNINEKALRRLRVDALAGVGFTARLNPLWSVQALLQGNYGLTPLYTGNGFRSKAFGAQAQVGLLYRW